MAHHMKLKWGWMLDIGFLRCLAKTRQADYEPETGGLQRVPDSDARVSPADRHLPAGRIFGTALDERRCTLIRGSSRYGQSHSNALTR